MANTTIISCRRRLAGKSSRQRIRSEGQIPGIIYAHGKPGTRVALHQRTLDRLFASHGPGGLFSLEVDDDPAILAVVRELQRNPIDQQITHVDFLRVDAAEEMEAAVAVQISGEEELRARGGFLQIGAREVEVKCLPQNLPEILTHDVSQLIPGDQIYASSLVLPTGVELMSEPLLLVASILIEHRQEEQQTAEVPEEELG